MQAIDQMIVDVLKAAGKQKKKQIDKSWNYKISNIFQKDTFNLREYLELTDEIIMNIFHSKDEKLKEPKEILCRLFSRKLYKVIFSKNISTVKLFSFILSKLKVKISRKIVRSELYSRIYKKESKLSHTFN